MSLPTLLLCLLTNQIAHQGILNFQLTKIDLLILKIASAQVVETSVTNNSPSQDSSYPYHHFQTRHFH